MKAIQWMAAACVALGAARADVVDEVNTGIGSIGHDAWLGPFETGLGETVGPRRGRGF